VIDAPLTPAGASAKSAALTPLTLALNVTVKSTLAAALGLGSARLSDTTVGAVLLIV
jgi:hypothetical protein